MNHELKSDAGYFNAVARKIKTFEIRKDDRNYQYGDTVTLINNSDPCKKISAEIGFVTNYYQRDGYVVFSLLNVQEIA